MSKIPVPTSFCTHTHFTLFQSGFLGLSLLVVEHFTMSRADVQNTWKSLIAQAIHLKGRLRTEKLVEKEAKAIQDEFSILGYMLAQLVGKALQLALAGDKRGELMR